MKIEDFDLLATLVKQRSGLVLTRDKAYLLESRLLPVARKWNCKSLDDLAGEIRIKRDEAMIYDLVEAMTTNETSFLRDQTPFDTFKKTVLPHLLQARAASRKLRIWSAACSTGQEAYSLAMLLLDCAPLWAGWTVEIIGTDLSRDVVEKARAGIYSQFEVQRGLPITQLVKYFEKAGKPGAAQTAAPQPSMQSATSPDRWQLKDNVRRMARFGEVNLLHELQPQLQGLIPPAGGPFDIIFCRNVLIYFDLPTKTKVLESLAGMVSDDGALFLGGAETVLGVSESFKPVEGQRGLYARTGNDAYHAAATAKTGTS